jgi:hypothetical protein
MSTDHTAAIHAELAIIRARMQAVLTMLPAGECPIVATDALYGRQEALNAMLWDMENVKENRGKRRDSRSTIAPVDKQ